MLSRFEKRVIAAVASTLLPLENVDAPALVERFLDSAEPPMRISTRLMLLAVELGPILWGFGLHRFSSLAPESRAAFFHRLERSPRWEIRNLFFSLKIVVMGVVYDEPDIARAICGGR